MLLTVRHLDNIRILEYQNTPCSAADRRGSSDSDSEEEEELPNPEAEALCFSRSVANMIAKDNV